MKKDNIVYNFINAFFLLGAILLIYYSGILEMNFSALQLISLIGIFLLIHTLKFIRIYFILLEERIEFKRMIKLYIKTTFVSVIYPYKIGELFKMYAYGNEISNYPKGIISVLIDKFFDAIILCIIIIPYGLIASESISMVSVILLIFIVLVSIIYFTFNSTYYYLNKFFIIKNKNKKGLIVLNILEKLNGIYKSTKELLKGRTLLLIILTFFIWLLEAVLIYFMSYYMNIKANLLTIFNYINDAFFGTNNVFVNNYVYLCTAIFLIIIVLMYFKKSICGGIKTWKK